MERFTSCTSLAVITKLKSVFARHGIAETVIRDNGPCYSSEEFRRFANAWDFTHTTTSPRYPQSNGLAEKTVQQSASWTRQKLETQTPTSLCWSTGTLQ